MTSPGSGVFQYQAGGTSASDPNAGFPNINPRSASTGGLLLPQQAPGSMGTPGSPANFRFAESGSQAQVSKNQAIQSLLVNSINDPDSTVSLQEKLIQAGYLSPKSRSFIPGSVTQDDATFYAVNNLFDDSIRTGVPFQQILDQKVKNHPKAAEANYAYYLNKFGAGGEGGTAASTVTKSRSSSATTLSPATDAQSALAQAMRERLGRAPTKSEVAVFQSALNKMQAAAPVVRQSTVVTDTPAAAAGQVAYPQQYESNSTTSGGLDPQVAASNYVQGNFQQEADQHGIVGYVNAFESLLKGG
jgi:hypothetical protein